MLNSIDHEKADESRWICILTENRDFGGVEIHTRGLMGALLARGYKIELVANRYAGFDPYVRERGWESRIRIVHTDLKGILYEEGTDVRGWSWVLRQLRSRTMIFQKGCNNIGCASLLWLCRRKFERIVFVEHLEAVPRPKRAESVRPRSWPRLGLWWYTRFFLPSRIGACFADEIVAVSAKVRGRLLEDYRYPSRKVSVVRNGIAPLDFARDEDQGLRFRRHVDIPQDAFVFGMLVRLAPEKGIDIALRAMQLLVQGDPRRQAYLLVAGDGSMREELLRMTQELGIEERVRFVGFIRRPVEMLSALDVIVFSSLNEGLPLALLEGMAAGCVPIVSRTGGMPEAVDAPQYGSIVSPQAPEELAAAMRQVMKLEAGALVRMREGVARRVREHFHIEQSSKALLEICGC
jgi:glycosyltransferase involved in cell wall biosynthesis